MSNQYLSFTYPKLTKRFEETIIKIQSGNKESCDKEAIKTLSLVLEIIENHNKVKLKISSLIALIDFVQNFNSTDKISSANLNLRHKVIRAALETLIKFKYIVPVREKTGDIFYTFNRPLMPRV